MTAEQIIQITDAISYGAFAVCGVLLALIVAVTWRF